MNFHSKLNQIIGTKMSFSCIYEWLMYDDACLELYASLRINYHTTKPAQRREMLVNVFMIMIHEVLVLVDILFLLLNKKTNWLVRFSCYSSTT